MKDKNKLKKIVKALIFGTLFFIIELIFILIISNVGTMAFQNQDVFTAISEFNNKRIEASQNFEGASSVFSSDIIFYTTFGIVLLVMWIFNFYIQYSGDGRI